MQESGHGSQAEKKKAQGAGSIKRDAKIWEEFCEHYQVDYELIAPKDNITKLSREVFKEITGWTGRTSEHSRDATMLIFNKKPPSMREKHD